MSFIAPEFLYALFFLAIPIIIHLFNFRRYKTLKFSQVRFLKDIKKETQSTSRLRHLLILLCRCLALGMLVLAFAQPVLIEENKSLQKKRFGVSIYIDNSFSMTAKGEYSTLLEQAKQKAIALIKGFGSTDKFQIVSNDFKAISQRWLNQEQAIEQVANIHSSPIIRSIDQVYSRFDQIEKEELEQQLFFISDLQKVSFSLATLKDSIQLKVLPISALSLQNFSASNISFQKPYHLAQQEEVIDYTIKRHNLTINESYSLKAGLFLNDKLKAPFVVEVEANEDSLTEQLIFRSTAEGTTLGELRIKDYPISFDDTLYFDYAIQKQLPVLHLFGEKANKNIKTLFENDSLIAYEASPLTSLDYSRLAQSNLLIIEGITDLPSGLARELKVFVEEGGSLLFIPTENMLASSVNAFLNGMNIRGYESFLNKDSLNISNINTQAALYASVFKELPKNILSPQVFSYWKLYPQQQIIVEDLLKLQNGNLFLGRFPVATGQVYIATADFSENSDFSQHALFVPTLFNMALQSVKEKASFYFLNEAIINLTGIDGESPVHLVGKETDLIPRQKKIGKQLQIDLSGQLQKAGHYFLIQEGDTLETVSLNYNRKESILSYYTLNALQEEAKLKGIKLELLEEENEALSAAVSAIEKGLPLWKYFIALSILFLLLELIFLRILK
jgi:hypothetical protein